MTGRLRCGYEIGTDPQVIHAAGNDAVRRSGNRAYPYTERSGAQIVQIVSGRCCGDHGQTQKDSDP